MEAVGLAASIIGLLGVAKKLGGLMGRTPESTVLIKRIVLDLTAVHECLEKGDSVDAGHDLQEACSELELSLTACLSECMSLSADGESRVRRFKALFRGRTKADIVLDLKRIDLDVTALLLRFMIKGLVRTEVSATNALSLTKQFRDEVHLRLDSIESRLKQQTSDKGPGGLLGRGTVTAVRGSLADSTADLRKSSNLPSEIQHSKHALPDSSRKRKGRDDEWEGDEDGTSHPYQSDIPSQRNEDVTLDLAEALLSASKLPYLPQQVADRAVMMSRELVSETKRSDSTDEAHINPTPISAVDAVERNSDSHDYNHASDEGHFLCCT